MSIIPFGQYCYWNYIFVIIQKMRRKYGFCKMFFGRTFGDYKYFFHLRLSSDDIFFPYFGKTVIFQPLIQILFIQSFENRGS